MELEGSLPHSQAPTTCPYPEPAQSSPYPPTYHFLKNHLNISSHLRLGLPNGLFPSGFPTNTLYTPLLWPIRATCPAHLIHVDLITRTVVGEQYRSLSSLVCNFLHSPVTSPLLGPYILLSTLFSNTLNLRSSLSVSDQVSHPYKTTGKIMVILTLTVQVRSTRVQRVTCLNPGVLLLASSSSLSTFCQENKIPD